MKKVEAQEAAAELATKFFELLDEIGNAHPKVGAALADVLDDVRFEATLGDDGHQTLHRYYSLNDLDAVDGLREFVQYSVGPRESLRSDEEIIAWRESRRPGTAR